MRPWVSLMTREEVSRSWEIAGRESEAAIVRLAARRKRRDSYAGAWFLASCVVPMLVGFAGLLVGAAAVLRAPVPWAVAAAASLLLPFPARKVVRDGEREGRVIALAYWLRKDPNFMRQDR